MGSKRETNAYRFLAMLFMAITAASTFSTALFLYAYVLPMLEDLKQIIGITAW